MRSSDSSKRESLTFSQTERLRSLLPFSNSSAKDSISEDELLRRFQFFSIESQFNSLSSKNISFTSVTSRRRSITMNFSKEQLSSFYDRKNEKKDSTEFVKNVKFLVEERDYVDANRKVIVLRLIFRLHLRKKVYE